MAKVIKEFPLQERGKSPLVKYLDGRIWRLQFGKDFASNPATFRSYLYKVSRDNGKEMRTTFESPTTIIVQAREQARPQVEWDA